MREFKKTSRFWEDLKSGRFAQMVRETSKGKSLRNSVEVYHVIKPLFAENNDVETVFCIFLDGQNHILAIEKMFSGTINCATVYPRELIKRVLALAAGAVVLVHNHPSGNTTPSAEDLEITKRLVKAGEMLGIEVLDHIIVGDEEHTSLKSLGKI